MSSKKLELFEIEYYYGIFITMEVLLAIYACHFEINWLRIFYKVTLSEIEFKDIILRVN